MMATSPPTAAGERRWTWVGRIADVYTLVAALVPVALGVAAGVSPPRQNLRELLLLASGVVALVAGLALAIKATIERGDAFLPCDARRNQVVTLRLWAGTALAVIGLALTVVAGVVLAR